MELGGHLGSKMHHLWLLLGGGHNPLLGPPWTSVPTRSARTTPGRKHAWRQLSREGLQVPRCPNARQTPVAEGGERKGVLPARRLGAEKNIALWSLRVATVKLKLRVAERIARSFLSSDLGTLSRTSLRANTKSQRAQPPPTHTDARGCHGTNHHTRSLSCLSFEGWILEWG